MTSVRPLTEQERVAFGDPTGPTGGRPGFGKATWSCSLPEATRSTESPKSDRPSLARKIQRRLRDRRRALARAGLWPADGRVALGDPWPSESRLRRPAWSKRPNRCLDGGRRRRRLFALT